MDAPKKILRGQIYMADLGEECGSIQGGRRPVLIVQGNQENQFSSTFIVVPITSQIKKPDQPTHYVLPKGNGLLEKSMVLGEQARPLNQEALGPCLGALPPRTMRGINKALAASMAISKSMYRPPRTIDEYKSVIRLDEVLTLCPTCLKSYKKLEDIIVRRVNHNHNKGLCCRCRHKKGNDYRIIKKSGRHKPAN